MRRKHLKAIAVCMLIVGLVTWLFPANGVFAESKVMPLVNTQFEDLDSNGAPIGWTPYAGDESTTSQALKIADFEGSKRLAVSDTSDSVIAGAESLKLTLPDYGKYEVSADVYVEKGSAVMQIRFYDSEKVPNVYGNEVVVAEQSGWQNIKVSMEAPIAASKVSVVFFSRKQDVSSFYVDNVNLTRDLPNLPQNVTSLGVQIRSVTVPTGVIGKDASGRDVIYTVITGDPAVLVIADAKTATIIKELDLPGIAGSWGMLQAKDGTVYIGGYTSPYLYRYYPDSGRLSNLGTPIPSGSGAVLYAMVESNDGMIYGAAYTVGKLAGSFYQYNPTTNTFKNMGIPVPGATYTRGMAYDPAGNKLYVGTGTTPGVMEYDLTNNTKRDILPAIYKKTGAKNIIYAYDLNFVNGRLIVRKDAGATPGRIEAIVLDTSKNAPDNLVTVTDGDNNVKMTDMLMYSRGTSSNSPVNDKLFYYTLFENGRYSLAYYDTSTDTFRRIKDPADPASNLDIKATAICYGFAELNEDGLPGKSMVALVGNGGYLCKFNIEKGTANVVDLRLPPQPTLINSFAKGPDNRIYSIAYLSGRATGVYSPVNGSYVKYTGPGQAEGITCLGNKMYFGVYPEGSIYEYDLSKPWNMKTGTFNPAKLFTLLTDEYGKQERPYAMLGVKEENKVYIGTVPYYGLLGGAFAVYDPVTQNKTVYVGSNSIAPNQSIVSLAYKDGNVFIGTSVAGGMGSVPTEPEGKLVVWDAKSQTKVSEIVPVQGKKAISGLMVGPDGNIWGMASGTLFIYNPADKAIVFIKTLFSGSADWRDAFLTIGTDGNVYGTASSCMFKIDAATKEFTKIIERGVFGLEQDDFGNLYTRNTTELLRYSPPELVTKPVGAEIAVSDMFLKKDGTAGLSLKKILLERNRSTESTADAAVEYVSSDTSVITVEGSNIRALKEGTAEISAFVTACGTRVESNKIKVYVVPEINAYLRNIKADGRTIYGFAFDKYDYSLLLPKGTSIVPVIEASTVSDKSTVNIINASTLPGSTVIEVTAEDGTKNKYTVFFDLDTQAPSTKAVLEGKAGNGWYSSDVTVKLEAQDDKSGVDYTEYRIGESGEWLKYEKPIILSNEGAAVLQYRSADKHGNTEAIKTAAINIDKSLPSYGLTTDTKAVTEGAAFDDCKLISFKAEDTLSGISAANITIDGVKYSANQSDKAVEINMAGKPGKHTAVIEVEDKAGNKLVQELHFNVTTSISSMLELIGRYKKSGEINSTLSKLAELDLKLAQKQLDSGKPKVAAVHMGTFDLLINGKAMAKCIKPAAKAALSADAKYLIKVWSSTK